ncbi:unnamed protein product [Zymoseptoria tritici ST99CH_1E4]|uniref:Amine oxidase domain-containing protein n=1 Tax=Zymoseptoria tritici ST99CH_1E4 TaxID=1276532 RepID=A0A2H1FYI4_ZYMTR|nr:unnamed protein product [Zymoseptoria tritici ST99CH_1E4]
MLIEIKGRGHRCNHSCSLANTSVTNFIVVEYNGYIGSRLVATDFGENHYGDPYRVELGANWVHGRGGNILNPINLLLQKHNDATVLPDYENYLTYNETGEIEIDLWDAYDEADMVATAEADWSIAVPHDYSSLIFNTAVENFTYGLFGDEEPFIVDSRGYNTIVSGEAFTFLQPNDPRLLLNTIVTDISHSDSGVTVHNADGTCISAAYAINTSSLGVLKHDSVSYTPALPTWKSTAIQNFGMTTYTKIFLQFPTTFWPQDTNSSTMRIPTNEETIPSSNLSPTQLISASTATSSSQPRLPNNRTASNAKPTQTQAEIMAFLAEMFPNITIPEPTAFLYPRWTLNPAFRGSYSYWPPGVTIREHQNVRAIVGRMFFAGEHTEPKFFGLLGRECLGSAGEPDDEACGELRHFELVDGDTPEEDLVTENRWPVESVAMESFGA